MTAALSGVGARVAREDAAQVLRLVVEEDHGLEAAAIEEQRPNDRRIRVVEDDPEADPSGAFPDSTADERQGPDPSRL
jgi:hypothetical protein